jgi:hypothetical protein
MAGQSFSVLLNDQVVASNILVPNTGGWQTWQTIKLANVTLSAGESVLKLLFASEYFNLNFILVEKSNVVTGIDDERSSSLAVYPNPSNGFISVQLSPGVKSVEVVGLDGKKIYTNHVVKPFAQHVTIEKKLDEGLYIVAVEYESGKREFKKAIVTHE